jgi:photosystem II stability/assembly factor-like uncharacterized protein
MAQDNAPRSAGGSDSIDEWIEREPRARPPQPHDKSAIPDPQIVQELEQLYRQEAQAVDRRLERVWHRVEQHLTMQQSRQEPASQTLNAFPRKRRVRSMKNPMSLFPMPRQWSARISAIAAVVLLVVLVGGLTAGLVLVRRGSNTNAQATTTPGAAATLPPTPTPSPTIINDLSIITLAMKDATNGWATGYSISSSDSQTQIVHTSDGGITWKNVTPHSTAQLSQNSQTALQPLSNGASVRTEDFITGSVAWVLVLPNQFFKTTDGGQTWQPETAPGESIRQFTFLDENTGWVITEEGGTIGTFQTTDGGATWTRVQTSANAFPIETPFWGMRFLNATTGWAVFLNLSVGSSATIYKTVNGGATWQSQHLALPRGAAGPISVNPPQFFNDQDGIIQVGFDGGIAGQIHPDASNQPYSGGGVGGLYVTHDGGTTWEGPIVLPVFGFPPTFSDVEHGWAIKSGGDGLLTTSDSGNHWTPVNTSANFVEIDAISFISNQTGWALQSNAGNGGFLLRTDDGGHTWQQLHTQITA